MLLPLLLAPAAPLPSVTDIEIVPFSVVVQHDLRSSTTFELEARLWTGQPEVRTTITEAQGYVPTWTSNRAWLTYSRSGHRAKFTVAGTVQGTATVTATAGNKTSLPAEITVIKAVSAADDSVSAVYTPDRAPNAVVVNGRRGAASGACGVTLTAFVDGSGLGNLFSPCAPVEDGWRAAVFSAGERAAFRPTVWTSSPDHVNAVAQPRDPLEIPLALRVMIGSASLLPGQLAALQNQVLGDARTNLASANGLLDRTHSGIRLKEVDSRIVEPAVNQVVPPTGIVMITSCRQADVLTREYDVDGVLNVYYVDAIPGYRGFTCSWHAGRPQTAIFVERVTELQTTFVHEVGHALGLMLPFDGHTDDVGGLDWSNVMTSGYHAFDSGGRTRLTVGQVFRMNADSGSWLNWAQSGNLPVRAAGEPRVACQCGQADPAGHCPRMADDVARPSVLPDGVLNWHCFDRLQFTNAPAYERPAAILAGRSWRAPPDLCTPPRLPGWEANRLGGIFVAFTNLTIPGDCESWAAVFFRHHGPLFVDLSKPEFGPTVVSNTLYVEDAMTRPRSVRVTIYNPVYDESLVDQDVALARDVFGPLNRGGVSLAVDRYTTSCPQAGPKPGRIQVCYVAGVSWEGTTPATGRIRIGKRRPSSLAHFIGRTLGLPTDQPAQAGNLMRSNPDVRGKKLTLGQAFRINARLGVLPDCTTLTCPELDMDGAP